MIHTAAERCYWIQYLMGNIAMSFSLFFSSRHCTFDSSRVNLFAKEIEEEAEIELEEETEDIF